METLWLTHRLDLGLIVCLGWRDREVVVGDVEPNVETTFVHNFGVNRCNTIRLGTNIQIISLATKYFYLSSGTSLTVV